MRTHYCQNCGSPLRGAFCQVCGQKDDDYRRPLITLTNEFLGDVFQWDSRVFRSIVPFLVMPGTLTRSYMRGQRQKYVSPLRLYIVMSIVFFLALTLSDRAIVGFTLVEGRDLIYDFPNIAEQLEDVDPQFLNYGDHISMGLFVDPDAEAVIPRAPVEDMRESLEGTLWGESLIRIMIGYNAAIDDPRVFNEVLNSWVPRLMVILVPFFAFVIGALYVRRRVYFIDHLVFSLHFHSFMFAVMLFLLGIASWTGQPLTGGGATGLFMLIVGAYLYTAMLRTYRGGVFKTTIKFMILGSVYANVFFVSLFLITVWGLRNVGS